MSKEKKLAGADCAFSNVFTLTRTHIYKGLGLKMHNLHGKHLV